MIIPGKIMMELINIDGQTGTVKPRFITRARVGEKVDSMNNVGATHRAGKSLPEIYLLWFLNEVVILNPDPVGSDYIQ